MNAQITQLNKALNEPVSLPETNALTSQVSAVEEPKAGWATLNPDNALRFLFVNPHDCAALDELLALPSAT